MSGFEGLGQQPAFAIEDDEVGRYLQSVREESNAQFYHTNRVDKSDERHVSPSVKRRKLGPTSQFETFKTQLLQHLHRLKREYSAQKPEPVHLDLDPAISKWKKHVFDNEPPAMGFFYGLERPDVFKLVVYCTRWLSVSVNKNLSQWIWCVFLRIDNVVEASEASVLRDLGKKALKLANRGDEVVRFTMDMVVAVVGDYYGQRDLLSELELSEGKTSNDEINEHE